jgi:hypothetical protein
MATIPRTIGPEHLIFHTRFLTIDQKLLTIPGAVRAQPGMPIEIPSVTVLQYQV